MEHDAASYTCPLQRLCDILAKLRVGQDGINDFEITGSKRHVRSRPASPAADFEARLSEMLTCDVEKEHRLVAREEADGRVATIYIPVMPYLTTKIRPHIRGFRSDDHIRKRRVERYNLKARRNIITVQWLRPFHIRPFDPPVNRVRSGVPLRRSCDHTGAARRPCRLYRFMARRAEKRQTRDLHRRRACAARRRFLHGLQPGPMRHIHRIAVSGLLVNRLRHSGRPGRAPGPRAGTAASRPSPFFPICRRRVVMSGRPLP